MKTVDQVYAELAIFTPEQRSLAFSPEPPHKSYASDCRAGGNCGLSGLGEMPRDKWVVARFRLKRENEALAKLSRACSKDHTQLSTRDVFFRYGLTWGCLECGASIRETAICHTRGNYRPGHGSNFQDEAQS